MTLPQPSRTWCPVVLSLLVLTFVVRCISAYFYSWPGIQDALYYKDVADHLVAGEGLTTRVLWNFDRIPESLVHPACAYWGPVVPCIIWSGYLIGGHHLEAAQGVMIFFGLVLLLQTLSLARRITESVELATAAGCLIAFNFQLNFFGVTTDTPIAFAVFANGCLLAQAIAICKKPHYLFLAAPFGVLSMLTRADGVVLPVLTFVWGLLLVFRHRISVSAFLGLILFHLLILAPWWARNAVTFGTPFPTAVTRSIAIREYSDLFRVHEQPSMDTFLAQGWRVIAHQKLRAFIDNLSTLVFGSQALLVLTLVVVIGPFLNDRLLWPYLLYFVLLFLTLSLLFSFQSQNGSLLHSLPALFPCFSVLAVTGVRRFFDRRAEGSLPGRNRRLFGILSRIGPWLLVLYSGLMWAGSVRNLGRPAAQAEGIKSTLTTWFDSEGSTRGLSLMSNDSLDMLAFLPYPVVQVPRDSGLDVIFEIARKYFVSYLVIIENQSLMVRPWDKPVYESSAGRLEFAANLDVDADTLGIHGIRIYRFFRKDD